MKNALGAAIGVLVLGLILMVIGLRAHASDAGSLVVAPGAATAGDATAVPIAQRFVDSRYATASDSARPVLVNCGPGERALIRQDIVNGEPVQRVDCVGDTASSVYFDQTGRPTSDVSVATPAAYRSGSIVRESRVYPEREYVPSERPVYRQPRQSWQKTALIIGGSTATGAGIGGLIGGSKGALIGAAIGGGGSTIYEATKRH